MHSDFDVSLICFDNDGTLFRSDEVANPAIQKVFAEFTRAHGLDLPVPTDERILDLTGTPGPVFYKAILPDDLADRSDEFRQLCIDEEVVEVRARGRFFDGISELLGQLHALRRKIVLVTNGGERYISAVAERLEYSRRLDGIYHFGKDGLKTKAAMIEKAMRDLGVDSAAMVGDRASDREAAEAVGIPFIGCAFGYGDHSEIESTRHVVHSVDQLAALLI